MAEYIDRGALIAWVEETYCKPCEKARQDYKHARCGSCQYGDMIQDIETRPAANVRPVVRGIWLTQEYMYGDTDVGIEDSWIERRAEYGDAAYCSICGKNAKLDGAEEYALTDYCPNCGADMRTEVNDG